MTVKSQLTAREYYKLRERIDSNRNPVKKIRQAFVWKQQYFVIDTIVSLPHMPCILRVETEKNEDGKTQLNLPKFIKVLREVTDDQAYDTYYMSAKDYELPERDRELLIYAKNTMEDFTLEKQFDDLRKTLLKFKNVEEKEKI